MFSVFAQDRAFIVDQIEKWQKAVSANPRDYETLTRIGAAYGKLGENDKAVTYFNKAIAVRPSYAEAYLGLGTAYGFLKQPENAVIALKKAISLAPNNPLAHGKLGTTLGRAGDYGAAIVELKEAIRLKPDMPDAHFALGLAYFSTGDPQRANSEVGILFPPRPAISKATPRNSEPKIVVVSLRMPMRRKQLTPVSRARELCRKVLRKVSGTQTSNRRLFEKLQIAGRKAPK